MPRSGRFWLWLILVAALSLRVGAALTLQWLLDHRWHREYLIEGDAEGYWMLGRAIAQGEDYAIYTPPRQVLRMPGFPALLALSMSLFGESFLAARLLLAFVGAAACGFVYWLGKEIVNPTIGLMAAAWAAASPTMIGFTPILLSETLFAATLGAALVVFAKVLPTLLRSAVDVPLSGRDRGLAVLAGGTSGLATLVRPSWLLALPLAYGLLLILSRRRWAVMQSGLLAAAGLLVVLLPWGIRNHRATGHFVLTTLWAGPSLYDGLNPQADGDSNMAFYDRDNLLGRGLSEYEVDRHYRRLAWRFAAENPGRAAELAIAKLARYWKPWPNAAQFSGWGPKLAVLVFFTPLLLCALYGGWIARKDWRLLMLSAGPLLYFSLLHTLFVSSLRYRLPAEYPLLVLAAVGLRGGWERLRNRRGKDSQSRVTPA